jgi:hypothetical protein
MKLTRVYNEGEDMGVQFEPGDKFYARRRTKTGEKIAWVEVVETSGGPLPTLGLREIVHPEQSET